MTEPQPSSAERRSPSAPLVAMIIPTWNRKADAVRCVESLPRLTYPNFLTVIVDNGSEDGTYEALHGRHPSLVLIRNATNQGYAGGTNTGIRWALDHGAQYLLLANNDTEMTPDLITELVRVAESDARIGVVGARNVLMADPARLWGAYGVLSYGPFLVSNRGNRRRDRPAWQIIKDVDWVIGNGALWRREAIEQIGLLDESLFAYHDDVDLCMRARRAGYRVVYAGTAAIVHKGGSSSDYTQRHVFPVHYFLGRNGVVLARRYGRVPQLVRFAFACSAGAAFRLSRVVAMWCAAPSRRSRAHFSMLLRQELSFIRGAADALRDRPVPFQEFAVRGEAAAGTGSAPAPAATSYTPEITTGSSSAGGGFTAP